MSFQVSLHKDQISKSNNKTFSYSTFYTYMILQECDLEMLLNFAVNPIMPSAQSQLN